jgi:hypothetical protein
MLVRSVLPQGADARLPDVPWGLEAIRDWGTEDLVAKADLAQQAANLEPASAASAHSVD